MRKFVLIPFAAVLLMTGCASSMISGGDEPGIVNRIPNGDVVSPQKRSLSQFKPFPLKIANRATLPKELKEALDPFFQTRGDYPVFDVKVNYAIPSSSSGFSGGYLGFAWNSTYEAEVIMNDWEEKSDLVFEFKSAAKVQASSKHEIGSGSGNVTQIMKDMGDVGYNNLAADVLSQLDARRPELDKLAKRFASWKNTR